MAKNQRVEEIELIRALAFIAIVFQHVLAGFIYGSGMSFLNASVSCISLSISRFGVPVFIFITGFVLFYNYEELNYPLFIKKRISKVVIPYIIWTLFYSIYTYAQSAKLQTAGYYLSGLAGHLLHGNAMYHLWFIILIIQFYILYPFFKKLVAAFKDNNRWVILFILVIVYQVIAIWVYHRYLPGIASGLEENSVLRDVLNYRDRNFLFWILYFVAGGIFAVNLEKIRKLISANFIVIIAGWILSLSYILYVSFKTASYNGTGSFIIKYGLTSPVYGMMIPYSIFSIILLYRVSSIIVQKYTKCSKLLCFIGTYSFGGYLVHAFFVSCCNNAVLYLLHGRYTLFSVLVSFLGTLILSLLTTVLISRLKISKYLFGRSNRLQGQRL